MIFWCSPRSPRGQALGLILGWIPSYMLSVWMNKWTHLECIPLFYRSLRCLFPWEDCWLTCELGPGNPFISLAWLLIFQLVWSCSFSPKWELCPYFLSSSVSLPPLIARMQAFQGQGWGLIHPCTPTLVSSIVLEPDCHIPQTRCLTFLKVSSGNQRAD